jgi:hypothetical protein
LIQILPPLKIYNNLPYDICLYFLPNSVTKSSKEFLIEKKLYVMKFSSLNSYDFLPEDNSLVYFNKYSKKNDYIDLLAYDSD